MLLGLALLHLREHLRSRRPERPRQPVDPTMEGLLSVPSTALVSVLSTSGGARVVLTGRWHVSWQGNDLLQPGTHRREVSQVVAALRTQARVHV
jgi:hypothetical protein